MADPITDLAYTWNYIDHSHDTPPTLDTVTLQLSWTAPDDVTNESSYVISTVVANEWTTLTTLSPSVVRTPGTGVISLFPPATSFTLISRTAPPPPSIGIQVQHQDADGNLSDALAISAVGPTPFTKYGIPHLPNTVDIDTFGGFVVNAQDSFPEIADCVEMIAGTTMGSRIGAPTFGVPELPLSMINTALVKSMIEQWEPRVTATVTVQYQDDGVANLGIAISTQTGETS